MFTEKRRVPRVQPWNTPAFVRLSKPERTRMSDLKGENVVVGENRRKWYLPQEERINKNLC